MRFWVKLKKEKKNSQTLVPGNNPPKGALLNETRALTLRGKP